ncbi:MAG: phosphate ABC transporter substrate-binding protein [Myxococcota bacterium]|nr:phosphate ABC transporter substrate-binding protein [Myxococcota bacterium]
MFDRRVATAVLALGLAACDKTPPPDKLQPSSEGTAAAVQAETATVRISGSSALQPLVNAAKEQFEAKYKGISVEVSAGGSKKGLADVAAGAVQIGDSDILAPDDLKMQLVDHRVAVVGFAAMANKGPFNEKVGAISMTDMAKIFTGALTNWKDVGGQPQPIVVINRAPGSGTRSVFGSIVLGADKFVEGQTEDNSGALVAKLKQGKGAISYLALSFVDPELRVLALKTEGGVVEPRQAMIITGEYPIWSYEHMYTKDKPTGAVKQFLDYMSSKEFQEHVLPTVKGFIPITQMKVSRDKG